MSVRSSRRELEVDALLGVDGERGLALGHVLHGGDGAGAHRELVRPAHRNGLADFVAVHLLLELVLVGAVHQVRHHEVVFQDISASLAMMSAVRVVLLMVFWTFCFVAVGFASLNPPYGSGAFRSYGSGDSARVGWVRRRSARESGRNPSAVQVIPPSRNFRYSSGLLPGGWPPARRRP